MSDTNKEGSYDERVEIAERLHWQLLERCNYDVKRDGDRVTFTDNGRRVTLIVASVLVED